MLVPCKLPEVILPVTAKLVNVPTEVMLPCAAVVTVPAVVAAPVSVAVIVPAAKLPDASRATTALAVLALVAFDVIVNAPVLALMLSPVPETASVPTPV